MARSARQAPAAPVLSDGSATGNKVAPGGKKEFNLTHVDQITFEAALDDSSSGKGSVEVQGDKVIYTAHNPGATESVKIKVKAKNAEGEYSATTLDLDVEVIVTTLELSEKPANMKVGDEPKVITATTNADQITAESDKTEFATVEVSGKSITIKAVAKGTANITVKATATGGKEKTIKWALAVGEKAAEEEVSMTIEPTVLTMYGKETSSITISGDLDSVTAESDKADTVKVNSQSTSKVELESLKVGTANITITGKKSSKKDKVIKLVVTVKEATTLSVEPNSGISVAKGDKQVFTVETNAEDFSMESLTPDLASVEKETKTATILAKTGTAQIKFTAQKDGSNVKTVTVDITCKAKEPTKPVLETETLEVDSGEIIDLVYTIVDGDTLLASIKEGSGKGSVKVIGNKIQYTAHKVLKDEKVTIEAKTTRDDLTSDVLNTVVTVKAPPAVKRPVLLTQDRHVRSGENKTFSFTVADSATLVIVKQPSEGTAEVKGNTIIFKAPTVEQSKGINISVKATKEGFPDSTELEFQIIVLSEFDKIPEIDPDFGIRDLTLDEAKQIMAEPSIPLEEKMELFVRRGPVEQRAFVSKIADYCRKMAPKNGIVNGDFGASQNYDLLNTIMEIVNFEDTERFKFNFDLVNAMFLVHSKDGDALNWVSVQRFDLNWKYGQRALNTYQNLVHIISTLCDLSTRPELVEGIDFDKALDKTTTLINDVAKANIVGYYKQ